MENLPEDAFGKKIMNAFKMEVFGQLYKPVSSILYCELIRKFDGNAFLFKLFFAFIYLITGITIYAFFKKISKNPTLSILSTFLSLLTVPYLHQVWLSLFTNILGVVLVLLSGLLFLKESTPLFFPLAFILSFFNAFTADDSRLFAIPFLIGLGAFYGFTKRRISLILFNSFWIILSLLLFIITGYKREISPPYNPLLSLFYYTAFISDYFIYALDLSGVLLFAFSTLLPRQPSNLKWAIYPSLFLSLSTILLYPPYPYTTQWHNFFFVTPSLPFQSFLFGMLIILSSFFHIKKSPIHRKVFSTEILIISATIIFVTGIFPKIRTDPSSRHLLLAYPLMIFITIETISEVLKNRNTLLKVLLTPFFISFLFHLITNAYNSSVREDAIYLSVQDTRIYLKTHRRYFEKNCLYIVGPNYFLPEIKDFVNPWGKNIVEVIDTPSGSLTDLKLFETFLNLSEDKCLGKKRYFLTMRYKPSITFYEGPGKKFFEYLEKTQSPLSDQYMMAQYAWMHLEGTLPVEEKLSQYPMIYGSSIEYKVLPIFLSELIHRLSFHIPLFLSYEIRTNIFEYK